MIRKRILRGTSNYFAPHKFANVQWTCLNAAYYRALLGVFCGTAAQTMVHFCTKLYGFTFMFDFILLQAAQNHAIAATNACATAARPLARRLMVVNLHCHAE